ncbi:Mu transposase C-terminal domain-containing protein [Azonexus sp.]|uniref:Mu transposase C-terminal domain-containing protein n=1 Tax=Azonexus sp. TaxID=1872668 RepID=UPI0027BA9185|nr:Mu transposase C-terminal domain-containing protein [Azonexus sp.]
MNAPLPTAVPRYSLADIAEALGAHRTSVLRRANKEAWPAEKAGRGLAYPASSLPKAIRETVQDWATRKLFKGLPEVASAPVSAMVVTKPLAIRAPISAEQADAEQLICQQARLCILASLRKAVASGQAKSESAAIDAWLTILVNGEATPQQVFWSALANDKNGFRYEVSYATGTPVAIALEGQEIETFAAKLTKRSLQRWLAQWKEDGDNALIPGKRTPDMTFPGWAPYFLAYMQRPQKPTMKSAYEAMEKQLKADGWKPHSGAGTVKAKEYPDYSTVTKWYNAKYSKLDAKKGRNTGSALNPFKFHHVRSAEGMVPLQEVHSDGWSTKFYAPHPVSGKWVTGEVWHSHDVATRKAYVHERAIGLSESTTVIMGSLYAVCIEDGEPLFWQTDNTGAVKNDRVEFDPVASMAARRSIEIVHNIPGNSQANGIAESFNRYLQERAKELATYKGDGQDSKTQIRIHKITNKLTKAASAADAAEFDRLRAEAQKVGCGVVFSCWADAVAWVKQVVAEFNDMPHRSLPKIVCPTTGKRRHQTPNERLADFVADGWERKPLSGEELIDAFRVHEVKRVTRGCVQIMGQRYHHADLDHHNGEDVLVAYDIEDGSQVYIKNLAGVPMYTASFYESPGYRAMSFVEIAMNKRVDKQLERLDTKKQAIEAQRPGVVLEQPDFRQFMAQGHVVESTAVRVALEAEPEAQPAKPSAEVLPSPVDAEIVRNRRINQMEDPALVRHLHANPADINPARAGYLLEQAEKIAPLYRLIDELGMWGALEGAKARNFEGRVAVSAN